jgi:hypothetical protein
MGRYRFISIITIAFLLLNGLEIFYKHLDTSKRARKDLQGMSKTFNTLSKSDQDKIGALGVGIVIGVIGISIIKR